MRLAWASSSSIVHRKLRQRRWRRYGRRSSRKRAGRSISRSWIHAGAWRSSRAAGLWSVSSRGSQNRRTSRDYERLCATAEAFIYVAMSRLMVRRLARL